MAIGALSVAGVLALTIAESSASPAGDRPQPAAAARPIVPRGNFLVSDLSGRLRVLDPRGKVVRRIPGRVARYGVQTIALSRDRRFAFVPLSNDGRSALYRVNLATGRKKRWFAGAVGPAMSPGRTRIAYFTIVRRNDIPYKDALVVRPLHGGDVRSTSLDASEAPGPTANVISWSPDGRQIAINDGGSIRIATLGPAGLELAPPIASGYLEPVFLDQHRVVALADCCIGQLPLVTIDLRSGRRHPFATVPAPPVTIRRLRDGVLLVVTASDWLMIVSHNHTRVIAKGVMAADR